ncbi:ATP-dependent DNA helicase RecG [Geodermatophilus obscurus]|uniref:Probable DNA 3'-5' helicase RecG n=1 Tax=Geodermatophilus obscurus (strain ATCC 25078 / DSM 43160 / JCM 3152 / CCUG 61914 / KCC A-0152 / KCTC 9177 / NBRC 13315 / NRRL B-3577 / G-20) TaxID=526225 RepID=D2SE34_GEOOG|nr:ATP-dependent DNA helicase RecG [Geodermatophilus obscurus]ADB76600.1 DEAD/DEAH box helicase domain protein [Geodermatophilus obscurus DSM 43160]
MAVDMATRLDRVLGAKTAKAMAEQLELYTVRDLLRHYPRRYAKRGEMTRLDDLQVGDRVTVLAQVRKVATRKMRNRPGTLTEVTVGDGAGSMQLVFFNRRHANLREGAWGLFAGTVGEYRRSKQFAHPDCHLITGDDDTDWARALIPIYPASKDVSSWVIQKSVRLLLDASGGFGFVEDPLPAELRARHGLPSLAAALLDIHRPTSDEDVERAGYRLKWDEALTLQLTLAARRRAAALEPGIARPRRPGGLLDAVDAALPFALTDGQCAVGEELAAELAREQPMHRLLQGEVGAGKTVVALRAMAQVVDAGGQAALLAPTEVLAAQHARSIGAMLGPLGRAGELDGDPAGTRVVLLTGSQKAAARRQGRAAVADGSAGIVVGTHALLQEGVDFADLGLVVVDEQHRFGVEQRDALRAKGNRPPHVLVMTATPIPRTVAMTVYGDLETSTLRQLPGGRGGVASSVVPVRDKPAWLDRAWERLREEVAAGRQAYVVCPRIGEDAATEEEPDDADGAPAGEVSDRRPPLAVLDVAEELRAGPLAGLRLEVLHGRMTPEDKEARMRAFAAGDVDVLVATTVVEVGVDVPNATVMVVLDADRFGVSQLHQLRGRVARGRHQGLCLLVSEASASSATGQRLAAVAGTSDGFELARLDLETRREGDVLGAAQSGRRSGIRMLSLLEDEQLIAEARTEATALLATDRGLADFPGLAMEVAALATDERAEYLEKA